jgi:hypothetical protein
LDLINRRLVIDAMNFNEVRKKKENKRKEKKKRRK